eukprot:scaffold328325_cov55-Tisochrysis_lutea.AAC.1
MPEDKQVESGHAEEAARRRAASPPPWCQPRRGRAGVHQRDAAEGAVGTVRVDQSFKPPHRVCLMPNPPGGR